MNIDLKPSDFRNKDDFVQAILARVRNLADREWRDSVSGQADRISRRVSGMSRKDLESALVGFLTRPTRVRAKISDKMRAKARELRKKGIPVAEIAAKLGMSGPSVYSITS